MKKFTPLFLCGIIIAIAVMVGKLLIESKPVAKPQEIVKQIPFVNVIQAKRVSQEAIVETFGTVQFPD